MSKVLFLPIGVLGGILAGVIGRKAFEGIWGVFDDSEAPDPKHREIQWRKLLPALILEGAIFRATRGVFEHTSRRVFSKLTGTWPGEDRPESA